MKNWETLLRNHVVQIRTLEKLGDNSSDIPTILYCLVGIECYFTYLVCLHKNIKRIDEFDLKHTF